MVENKKKRLKFFSICLHIIFQTQNSGFLIGEQPFFLFVGIGLMNLLDSMGKNKLPTSLKVERSIWTNLNGQIIA